MVLGIDLVTVFDAILTSRQTREKLQCLYENLMSDNFRKTAVLKEISIVNESYNAKDCPKKFWGRNYSKFLQRLALDFPYICLYFSRDILTDKCIENLKKWF